MRFLRCAARALAPLSSRLRDTANARVTASTDRAARKLFATVALDLIQSDPLQLGAAAGCAPQQKWLVQTMRTGLSPAFSDPRRPECILADQNEVLRAGACKRCSRLSGWDLGAGSCVLRCCAAALLPDACPTAPCPVFAPFHPGVRTWYLSHLSRLPYPLRHRPKTDYRRHCTCNTYLLTYR